MKVLLNLSTLKKGGGQNVALNFLDALGRADSKQIEFHYVVVKNSSIHKFLNSMGLKNISFMPENPILRIIKEFLLAKSIIRINNIDIVYTYFGIGLYPKSIPQVSGSADSNIFFPEINFWSDYSKLKKYIKKIIDKYRIWGLKRMTAIVFENEIIHKRGCEIFKLQNTIYIKPSINASYNNVVYNLPIEIKKEIKKGLFFCGWHRNKNFMIIPFLAAELRKRNINFHFMITANKDNSLDYIKFQEQVEKFGVQDMISVIGSIKKEEISSLYEQIDFVFLLSKLESFSNNIIEAWYFKKPLIISNELWAKSICKEAAVYVNRENSVELINELERYLKNKELLEKVIIKGCENLLEYPTIEERTNQELNYLKLVYETF